MKKTLLIMALAAVCMPSAFAQDSAPETRTLCVGNFDQPGDAERREGAGSWWEKAPFQFYTKYSGLQIIYTAQYLKEIADNDGAITEIVFKYGDEGSTTDINANLGLLIENTEATEFQKKPESEQYMWVNYDPSTSASEQSYQVDLYYYEDEEIHFVLDKPLTYTGKSLLITAWSEVTNGSEAQSMVCYAMRTGKYTTMCYGSDRYGFDRVYDTGVQEPYMGPQKYVPVTKFVYTKSASIASVAADSDAPATFFNLQGQQIDGELTPGLYIRRQGDSAKKVIIR